MLSKNRCTEILNIKKTSLSQDLNSPCSGRMPSLYHLCHHHHHSGASEGYWFLVLQTCANLTNFCYVVTVGIVLDLSGLAAGRENQKPVNAASARTGGRSMAAGAANLFL